MRRPVMIDDDDDDAKTIPRARGSTEECKTKQTHRITRRASSRYLPPKHLGYDAKQLPASSCRGLTKPCLALPPHCRLQAAKQVHSHRETSHSIQSHLPIYHDIYPSTTLHRFLSWVTRTYRTMKGTVQPAHQLSPSAPSSLRLIPDQHRLLSRSLFLFRHSTLPATRWRGKQLTMAGGRICAPFALFALSTLPTPPAESHSIIVLHCNLCFLSVPSITIIVITF
ncbi:unnamed protein product [Periconia digitata]|uniref:Uncharacterized protein n=1 Tax=Periconia digitata TaxID=1303443 RepID=A0A9W4XN81_9PLEO|nr:unnamed protein product [Periconia digitata]